MAIPWLLALKVIPWGDVIEHAPKVVEAARKMMDRQRAAKAQASTPAMEVIEIPPSDPMAWRAALQETRGQLAQMQRAQEQLTQTVADLAEQNARLVAAVDLLRLRTRVLMVVAMALMAAVLWLALRA